MYPFVPITSAIFFRFDFLPLVFKLHFRQKKKKTVKSRASTEGGLEMIVASSRERLFISLSHVVNTKDEENDFFLSMKFPFYGDSKPKAIKRRRK